MRTLDDGDGGDDAAEVVFRDMILLTLGALFVVVALMFPYLNPRARQAQAASAEPPGSVMVELNWPDDLDADVDLWVQAPGDVPVGYSNKGGAIFNLLRDDLGMQNLPGVSLRMETAVARGVPP